METIFGNSQIKGLLGKIACDFIFKRQCLQMSITEYFCNHERIPLKNTSFLDFFGIFLFFCFLLTKILYIC